MAEWDKINGISTDAVLAATGRGWAEWLAVLDAAAATKMTHPEIASLLAQEHGVPYWWCQMVTVGFEQARGMRAIYQRSDGYTASVSKTIAVPVERLFAAWADAEERARWLGDVELTIRKATPGKSLRVRWADDTPVDVELYVKGETKSQIVVQHARLADAAAVAAQKAFWSAALGRLKSYLEG